MEIFAQRQRWKHQRDTRTRGWNDKKESTHLSLYRQWQSLELVARHLWHRSEVGLPFVHAAGPRARGRPLDDGRHGTAVASLALCRTTTRPRHRPRPRPRPCPRRLQWPVLDMLSVALVVMPLCPPCKEGAGWSVAAAGAAARGLGPPWRRRVDGHLGSGARRWSPKGVFVPDRGVKGREWRELEKRARHGAQRVGAVVVTVAGAAGVGGPGAGRGEEARSRGRGGQEEGRVRRVAVVGVGGVRGVVGGTGGARGLLGQAVLVAGDDADAGGGGGGVGVEEEGELPAEMTSGEKSKAEFRGCSGGQGFKRFVRAQSRCPCIEQQPGQEEIPGQTIGVKGVLSIRGPGTRC